MALSRTKLMFCTVCNPNIYISSFLDFGCYQRQFYSLATLEVPKCFFNLSELYKKNENVFSKRFSTQNTESDKPDKKPKLPQLMDFPKLVWPSIGKTIKNFFLTNFIIKPYMDKEFNLSSFVNGSKQAVEVVSNKLSLGDLNSLEGLVTKDVISNVQQPLSTMSMAQREDLAISAEDIYFSFPYQVGIMFEKDDQQRFVEITMVHHTLKGLAAMRSRGEEPPVNMGLLPEYQNRISILNYRYIKEFTKGVESDWTINLLNHFKPVDDM